MSVRMVPAGGPGGQAQGVAGAPVVGPGQRFYNVNAGSFTDVPGDMSGDAAVLSSQGFLPVALSGTTAQRPSSTGNIHPGLLYLDTSLNLFVVWTGTVWVNPITGATA